MIMCLRRFCNLQTELVSNRRFYGLSILHGSVEIEKSCLEFPRRLNSHNIFIMTVHPIYNFLHIASSLATIVTPFNLESCVEAEGKKSSAA